jgi:hypothetical protein
MTTKINRTRKKINTKIDEHLVAELITTATQIDFPASRIVEDGIIFILKNKKIPSRSRNTITSINLTINIHLWMGLKKYARTNNFKLARLLEEGIIHSLKRYNKKIPVYTNSLTI